MDSQIKFKLSFFAGLALFLLGALYFVGRSTYAVGPIVLLLLSSIMLSPRWRALLILDKETRRLIMVMLIFAGIWAAAFLVDVEASLRLFDRPLRVILAIPVLLCLMLLKPHWRWLAIGVALGAMSAGIFSIYQVFYLGFSRAQGHFNPIQFGNMSMLWGVLCAALALFFFTNKKEEISKWKWWAFLFFTLSAAMGVLGSLLSGSRGGWIGIPFIFLVLLRAYGDILSFKFKLIASLVLLVLGLLVWSLPQLGVQSRIMQAVDEVKDYVVYDRNHGSSVGQRLQMWENALKMFPERPLLGWGDQGYREHIRYLAQQGVLSENIEYVHAHNQFVDFLVKHGLLGFFVIMLLFFYPFWVFGRHLKAKDDQLKLFAVMGSLLCVGFIDFGLTQAVILHMGGLMAYIYLLVSLWALMKNRQFLVSRFMRS